MFATLVTLAPPASYCEPAFTLLHVLNGIVIHATWLQTTLNINKQIALQLQINYDTDITAERQRNNHDHEMNMAKLV